MSKVLVVGDLHCPFDLDGYLTHCKSVYKKYNCDTVVFIGDVIDNHYSSYHETFVDGYGGGSELQEAIEHVKPYYKAFPNATVIIGNHDRIVMRKGQTSNIPQAWLRSFNEVLGTDGWDWKETHFIDGVQFVHGEGGTARTMMKNEATSIVAGHRHTQCYIEHLFGHKTHLFAVQVGCGVDHSAYAMAYAKYGKKPAISCAVILDGKTPIIEVMEL